MVRKTNFLRISVLFSEIVTFWLKRKVLYEFLQKCFKTRERHNLAVCGSLWGEKQLLLFFIPFYWFDQKQLFKLIQIFHRICSFPNIVRKTNFLSISVLVSKIATFLTKMKSSLWISWKIHQNNRKSLFSSMWLTLGRKTFFLIFVHFYWFDKKNLCIIIQVFLRIFSLSNMVRKKNFLCISMLISELVTFLTENKSSLWISMKTLQKNRKA